MQTEKYVIIDEVKNEYCTNSSQRKSSKNFIPEYIHAYTSLSLDLPLIL